MTDLTPDVLIRLGGASPALLSVFNFDKTNDTFAKWILLKKSFEDCKLSVGDKLHAFNQNQTDKKIQQAVQNFRRSLHNDKKITIESVSGFKDYLSSDFSQEVDQLLNLARQLETLYQHGSCLFDQELAANQKAFVDLANNENLQKGLLLSSLDLYNEVESFLGNKEITKKKRINLESSLLKYISRIIYKPSPFSTFAQVTTGTINGVEQTSASFSNGRNVVNTFVTLDALLFKIMHDLLLLWPSMRKSLLVKVNPNHSLSGDDYMILNIHTGSESFARIRKSPVVDLLIETVTFNPTLTFSELVNVCQEHIDASAEALTDYLSKFIDGGLLMLDLNISDTEVYWNEKLRHFLERSNTDASPEIQALTEGLTQLEQLRHEFSLQKESRKQILRQAADVFTSMYNRLKKTIQDELLALESRGVNTTSAHTTITACEKLADFIWPSRLFNEISSSDIAVKFNRDEIEKITNALSALSQTLSTIPVVNARTGLASFYNAYYASEKSVPLVQFYQAYTTYRKERQQHAQPSELADQQPIPISTQVSAMLSRAIVDASEIKLHSDLSQPDFPGTSFMSATLQMNFSGNGSFSAVLNSMAEGYGKPYGRFLHGLSKDVQHRLIAANKSQNSAATILVENRERSFFTINGRPPLLHHVFNEPVETEDHRPEMIPGANLVVQYDSESDEVVVIDRSSNREVRFINLDLLNPKFRSSFFSFLGRFSEDIPFSQLQTLIEDASVLGRKELDEGLTMTPRIVFNDTLVLKRKTWRIANGSLPSRQNNETEWAYYMRVNTWRMKYGIPDQIFVAISNAVKGSSNDKHRRSDDYKPQFIDFNNPYFVRLVEKLSRKMEGEMKIEEMLPDHQQLIKTTSDSYAMEVGLQWKDQ